MKLSKFLGFFTVTLAFVALALGFVYSQEIVDWYKLRDYTPTSEVATLADNTTMVASARSLFYVNHPLVADKDTFNEKCRDNEYSIVLGCYLSGQQGIYLLDVTDDRLSGIKEVTAAHEFLHAAYERLSSKEKKQVDDMLSDAFSKVTDTRIKASVEQYNKNDPSVVPNELHSILGSELRDMSPELEKYYSRYFSNRLKIVSYSEQYEQAFINRQKAVREFDIKLAALKSDIETSSNKLNQESTDLTNLRSKLNQLKSQDNIDEYNSLIPGFNTRVNSYNENVDELSAKVVKYNETVQERNSVVLEESQLIDAIDSRNVVPDQR